MGITALKHPNNVTLMKAKYLVKNTTRGKLHVTPYGTFTTQCPIEDGKHLLLKTL